LCLGMRLSTTEKSGGVEMRKVRVAACRTNDFSLFCDAGTGCCAFNVWSGVW
jgi:hypothetical protein